MSVEVVQLRDHRVYLIIGDPDTGYDVHPAGNTVAHYRHKFEARHAINHGELQLSDIGPSETAPAGAAQPGGRRKDVSSPPAATPSADDESNR